MHNKQLQAVVLNTKWTYFNPRRKAWDLKRHVRVNCQIIELRYSKAKILDKKCHPKAFCKDWTRVNRSNLNNNSIHGDEFFRR